MNQETLSASKPLQDKVMLITGASSGIGKATAQRAAEAGMKLVLTARSEDKLTALCDELDAETLPVVCDVQSWQDQQNMAKQAVAKFGQIDVVYANAGVGSGPGGYSGADPEQWRDAALTNVLGPALTLRATLEHIKQQQGHVLITGSVAGRRTLSGSFYGITKWAMAGMARNVREELKGTGVKVTLVEPGMVNTAFFDDEKEQALQADDIARSILFTLSQPARVEVHDICILPTPATE